MQHWYDASVSALDGDILYWTDWIGNASYNVFPLPIESPHYGSRTIEVDPHTLNASPFGWHDTNGITGAEFTDTRGNNVFAQEDRDDNDSGGFRPNGGVSFDFDFPLKLTQDPIDYESAAITNLFYWNNILHDVHLEYGFDEAAGNFQVLNYTGDGLGDDPVQADAQDGSGFNNANFGTPPDGFAPRMQQFIFTLTIPDRDSSIDNGIVIHEYGHGVSNRLMGGPSNVGALTAIQSGGMGEGWSDWWALMLTQDASDSANSPRPTATYVLGQDPVTGNGLRRFPYSFDMSINPLTYDDFNGSNEVHDAGEIWTSALWDLNWLLIDGGGLDPALPPGMGFDADLNTETGGNNLAFQLVMDGLKLQPANPSFLDARDAILVADQMLTGGANHVAIWTAFARRGMGFSADDGGSGNATTVVAAFDLPATRQGGITFDQSSYEVGDSVGIELRDIDLAASGPVDVDVVTSGGDAETVSLSDLGGGIFASVISTTIVPAVAENGLLEVAIGDVITVTYNDANDGTGNSVVVTDDAPIVTFFDLFVADFSDQEGDPSEEGFVIDNTGGTADGLWHLTTRRGTEPDHSSDDSFYFGDESTGSYDVGRTAGRITSPTINLSGVLDAELTFNYFLESEMSSGRDVAKVQVSSDGADFTDLSVTLVDPSNGFLSAMVPLSTFVDSSVRIRFDFDTIDTISNDFEGWYVDDVTICGAVTDASLVGPRIANITPRSGEIEDLTIDQLFVEFSEVISEASSLDPKNYLLLEAGPNNIFEGGVGDDFVVPFSPALDANQIAVTLTIDPGISPLPLGSYQLTVDGTSSIEDLDGDPLFTTTGPGGGMDHIHEFDVVFNFPVGGNVYEIDVFAGELLTINTRTPFDDLRAFPLNDLDPELTLYSSATGLPVAADQDSLDDKNAQIICEVPASGTYLIQVGAQSGQGEYLLETDIVTLGLPDYDASGKVGLGDLSLVLFNWQTDGADVPPQWVRERPAAGTTVGLDQLFPVLFNWDRTSRPVPPGPKVFNDQPQAGDQLPPSSTRGLSTPRAAGGSIQVFRSDPIVFVESVHQPVRPSHRADVLLGQSSPPASEEKHSDSQPATARQRRRLDDGIISRPNDDRCWETDVELAFEEADENWAR